MLGEGAAEPEKSARDVSADAAYAHLVFVLVTARHILSRSNYVGSTLSQDQFHGYRPAARLSGPLAMTRRPLTKRPFNIRGYWSDL